MKPDRFSEGRIRYLLYNNPMPAAADLPRISELLQEMGTNLKLARLRRRIRTKEICDKTNISRTTLWSVERGDPAVAIGTYAKVLYVLKMEHEISKWGADDPFGQKIRDEELRFKQPGPRPKMPVGRH